MKFLNHLFIVFMFMSPMVRTGQAENIAELPQEMQKYLLSFLVEADSLEEAVDNIKSAKLTNKMWQNYLDDKQFVDFLIMELQRLYNASEEDVLLALGLGIVQNSSFSQKVRSEEGENIFKKAISELSGDIHPLYAEKKLSFVKLLLKLGADPNLKYNNGNTPLLSATFHNNLEMVNALIAAGADPNMQDNDGHNPLLFAVRYNNLEMVNALIAAGANNPNMPDFFGNTPLLYATHNNNIDMVNALITANADPNLKDNNGNTPLLHAVNNNNLEIVSALITADADLNIQNNDGNTPLLYALRNNNFAIANALINAGANPNIANNHGDTPLLWATHHDNLDMIKILIKTGGADPNLKVSSNITTPLQMARQKNLPEIEKFLIEAGAIE